MPVPTPPRSRPRLRKLVREPWTAAARRSPALRSYCGKHGYLTPHFSIAEMADTQTHALPIGRIRNNARRHCFNLERFKHALGGVPVSIDGPYRTREHNRRVGGAQLSKHVEGLATDHFKAQVERWAHQSHKSVGQIVRLAETIFTGVGNENSGTLHLDSRPGPLVTFTTWVASR